MGMTGVAFARQRQQAAMLDPATLTHRDGSTAITTCYYRADGTLSAIVPGLEPQPRFEFWFPYADPPTPQQGDTALLAAGTWALNAVLAPKSAQFSTATRCYAYQLTDAAGTPLYLRPNATVSVTRQDGTAVTGGTNRPVHIADSRATMERLMPYGEVGDRMLLDVLTADYQASDIVTIVTFGSSMAPIGFADYVVQAQPVANSEAGVEWLEVWLRGHRNVPNG